MTKWRPLVATFLCIHPIPGHVKDAKEGPKGARKRKNQLPERDEVKDDIMTKIFLPFVLSVTPILLSNTASLSLTHTHTHTNTLSRTHVLPLSRIVMKLRTLTLIQTYLVTQTLMHSQSLSLTNALYISLWQTEIHTHLVALHTYSLSLTHAHSRSQSYEPKFSLPPPTIVSCWFQRRKNFLVAPEFSKFWNWKKNELFSSSSFFRNGEKEETKTLRNETKGWIFFNFISFKGKPRF